MRLECLGFTCLLVYLLTYLLTYLLNWLLVSVPVPVSAAVVVQRSCVAVWVPPFQLHGQRRPDQGLRLCFCRGTLGHLSYVQQRNKTSSLSS